MKEVQVGRVAGPFEKIPFKNYIQSLIGLVPKKGKSKTRLIFHLSYDFTEAEDGKSLNGCTPKEICTVKYNDLDHAVRNCIIVSKKAEQELGSGKTMVYLGKTDLSNAFRVLPLKITCICWLVFKAVDPRNGEIRYFVDKCLPFGTSISCVLYQKFSNALRHLMNFHTGQDTITNYLDDFLFMHYLRTMCNQLIRQFLLLCQEIGVPVAEEKTEWATTLIGILLNGKRLTLSIPLKKQEKALRLLNDIIDRKKATIKQIQVLTGYLNFLTKAIFPGRTFTRRMYVKCAAYEVNKTTRKKLKQHHHITLDNEFRFDCQIWSTFLHHYSDAAVCRPMVDLNESLTADQLQFYSDASAAKTLGFGAVFNDEWLFGQWEENYISHFKPNIEYLELYALVAAFLTWGHQIRNTRMILYCDNSAVVTMINTLASGCKNCMYLLHHLTLNNLVNNRRVFAAHVKSADNYLANSLSRLQFACFRKLAPKSMDSYPTRVSPLVWPASKIWQRY